MYSSYPQEDPLKKSKRSRRSNHPQQQQQQLKTHQSIDFAVFCAHIKIFHSFNFTCPKTNKDLGRQSNRF